MTRMINAKRVAFGGSVLAALFLTGCGGGNGGGSGVGFNNIVALTSNNQLVNFSSSNPSNVGGAIAVTGLQGGENLIGIDKRPLNGAIFGLGNTSRLYHINTTTGVATQVGVAGAFALSGANFGFNFNPQVDRIRIVSNTEQNLRISPVDGSLSATDTSLAYAAGDPNFGANPNVVAASYTNSTAGAPSTALFGIDTNLDILVRQNPPNNGTLNTVGPLGVNASDIVAFDISPNSGSTTNNVAFAVLNVGGVQSLYTINLTTGAATLVGAVSPGTNIVGLTVVS